jgi:hypothetical protein
LRRDLLVRAIRKIKKCRGTQQLEKGREGSTSVAIVSLWKSGGRGKKVISIDCKRKKQNEGIRGAKGRGKRGIAATVSDASELKKFPCATYSEGWTERSI